jgi:hypothetical protein
VKKRDGMTDQVYKCRGKKGNCEFICRVENNNDFVEHYTHLESCFGARLLLSVEARLKLPGNQVCLTDYDNDNWHAGNNEMEIQEAIGESRKRRKQY